MNKLSANTQCQKHRLLEYLRQHGRITTITARAELDIMMPATRIFELKQDGHNIMTYRRHRKIAEYVLLSA